MRSYSQWRSTASGPSATSQPASTPRPGASSKALPEAEAAGALAVIHPAQGPTASASASTHLPSPQEAAQRPGQATVTPSE
eukprot:13186705-Heterocapsa_arctica.AAC.1